MAITWNLGTYAASTVIGGTTMYLLKEAMKTAGWVIVASADGATYSLGPVVDKITSPAVFIQANAWIVMRGPGGRQFLLGHKGGTDDKSWCIAYSKALGFGAAGGGADGNATTYPTALDTGSLVGNYLTGAYATMFGTYSSRIYVMVDGLTDRFWGLARAQAIPPYGHGGIFCDVLTNTSASDSDPAVIGSFYGNGNDPFSGNGLYTDSTTNNGGKAWYPDGLGGSAFQTVGIMVSAYDYTSFPAQISAYGCTGINPNDGKADLVPAIWARSTVQGGGVAVLPLSGYKGVSSLFQMVGAPMHSGETLDVGGTRTRMVFGEYRTAVNWNGSLQTFV